MRTLLRALVVLLGALVLPHKVLSQTGNLSGPGDRQECIKGDFDDRNYGWFTYTNSCSIKVYVTFCPVRGGSCGGMILAAGKSDGTGLSRGEVAEKGGLFHYVCANPAVPIAAETGMPVDRAYQKFYCGTVVKARRPGSPGGVRGSNEATGDAPAVASTSVEPVRAAATAADDSKSRTLADDASKVRSATPADSREAERRRRIEAIEEQLAANVRTTKAIEDGFETFRSIVERRSKEEELRIERNRLERERQLQERFAQNTARANEVDDGRDEAYRERGGARRLKQLTEEFSKEVSSMIGRWQPTDSAINVVGSLSVRLADCSCTDTTQGIVTPRLTFEGALKFSIPGDWSGSSYIDSYELSGLRAELYPASTNEDDSCNSNAFEYCWELRGAIRYERTWSLWSRIQSIAGHPTHHLSNTLTHISAHAGKVDGQRRINLVFRTWDDEEGPRSYNLELVRILVSAP